MARNLSYKRVTVVLRPPYYTSYKHSFYYHLYNIIMLLSVGTAHQNSYIYTKTIVRLLVSDNLGNYCTDRRQHFGHVFPETRGRFSDLFFKSTKSHYIIRAAHAGISFWLVKMKYFLAGFLQYGFINKRDLYTYWCST